MWNPPTRTPVINAYRLVQYESIVPLISLMVAHIPQTPMAVFPQKYESMAGLIPYQWLYILFMLGTIAIGVWGSCALGRFP